MLSKMEGGPFERTKALIELALTTGRQFQSKQTGYIHYFPRLKQGDTHQTIPLYENFLFALALLRSRLVEQVNEAKTILTGLLYFQHTEGNFPLFLHEYPVCKDALAGIDCIAPLYWMLKHFGHVIGAELKGKLEKSLELLISYALKTHKEISFPYARAVRFAAGLVAGGRLFRNSEWEQLGSHEMQKLAQVNDGWVSTSYLADLLVSLQMADIDPFEGTWKTFGQFLIDTWQKEVCSYVGPAARELQYKLEPLPTLYDLFMGNYWGTFSQRSQVLGIYHLEAALIQPSEENKLPSLSQDCCGIYNEQKWECHQGPDWALTLLEKNTSQVNLENTFSPFRFVWGDQKFAHTFVSQGAKCSTIDYKKDGNRVELFFDLDREVDLQDREKQREMNFYFDFHPNYKILVDGQTATTFEMGQLVTLQLNDQKISLNFELVEGDGHFLGHVSHGNRPSQAIHDADLRFEAYDWNLFIRTIRREGKCRFKVSIQAFR